MVKGGVEEKHTRHLPPLPSILPLSPCVTFSRPNNPANHKTKTKDINGRTRHERTRNPHPQHLSQRQRESIKQQNDTLKTIGNDNDQHHEPSTHTARPGCRVSVGGNKTNEKKYFCVCEVSPTDEIDHCSESYRHQPVRPYARALRHTHNQTAEPLKGVELTEQAHPKRLRIFFFFCPSRTMQNCSLGSWREGGNGQRPRRTGKTGKRQNAYYMII